MTPMGRPPRSKSSDARCWWTTSERARFVHRGDAAEMNAGRGDGDVAQRALRSIKGDERLGVPSSDALVIEVPAVEHLAVGRRVTPGENAGATHHRHREARRDRILAVRDDGREDEEVSLGHRHRAEELGARDAGAVGQAVEGFAHVTRKARGDPATDGLAEPDAGRARERFSDEAEAPSDDPIDEVTEVRERPARDRILEERAVLIPHLVVGPFEAKDVKPFEPLVTRGRRGDGGARARGPEERHHRRGVHAPSMGDHRLGRYSTSFQWPTIASALVFRRFRAISSRRYRLKFRVAYDRARQSPDGDWMNRNRIRAISREPGRLIPIDA